MASRREFLKGSVSAAALSGCSTLAYPQAADTLIVNGRIATLDPKSPNAEAIAIRGERIVEVGNPGELEKYRGPNTRHRRGAAHRHSGAERRTYALHPRRAHLHQRSPLGRRAFASPRGCAA